jgi:phosphoribosylformylglycinamidine cyclo-ligase
LPKGSSANIKLGSWNIPPIFNILQEAGNVEQSEMYRTFNMGIGMVLAVAAKDVDDILSRLSGLGEQAWLIGEVKAQGKGHSDQVVLS